MKITEFKGSVLKTLGRAIGIFHRRHFDLVGKPQILLITKVMALLYSGVPIKADNLHKTGPRNQSS